MDDIDRANDTAEFILQTALHNREQAPAIVATGRCLYCDAEVPEGHRWCDAECRDEWQREEAKL